MTGTTDRRPPDAVAGSWVDRLAPAAWRPYLRLTRLDRPIGAQLLMWPCLWALALAARVRPASIPPPSGFSLGALPDPLLLALFIAGAFIMRGAGCTYNDIVDRDIDAQVARTRMRPIPSGAVGVPRAIAWMVAQGLLGLAILMTFNPFARWLGLASLAIIALYPFAKRVTFWPQFVLGLAFNWGALLGWAATTGGLSAAPIVLYLGGIGWTLGYDTIYAHQDRRDDHPAGVKSSALKLGRRTKPWLWVFYGWFLGAAALAAWLAGTGAVVYVGLGLAFAHAVWQITTLDIDAPADCLAKFRANHTFGWIVFLAILAGNLLA